MDSHTFIDPELVALGDDEDAERSTSTVTEPSSPAALSWRVHVLRHGVPEPIDSILINSTTLPPRRNKAGKIVWKLPDDPGQVPKFGIHEQKRMWELYKEQKKQRRKRQSGPQNQTKDGETENGNNEGADCSGSALLYKSEDTPALSSPPPPQSMEQSSRMSVSDRPTGSEHGQTPVSPPPGFGSTGMMESLSLEETPSRRTVNPQFFQQQSTPQRSNLTSIHIPPPPGLAGAMPCALPPTQPPTLQNGNHTSHATSAQSPPRVVQADVPHAVPSAIPNRQQCNYFTVSSAAELASFPQSLAALVAHAFQRLISVVGSPVGVSEWLSYYTPSARSTLIMGTAQAAANTFEERRRQWQSLSSSSAAGTTAAEAATAGSNGVTGKRWECSGWTAQAVAGGGGGCGGGGEGSEGGVGSSDSESPKDVLVVLAGRTLQQHLLSFHLTLLLQCQRPSQHNGSTHPSPIAFQISNEILALALLT